MRAVFATGLRRRAIADNSIVVFESEQAARSAAERLQPPPQVTVENIEVREVVAHA
jgi:hypothetical protein